MSRFVAIVLGAACLVQSATAFVAPNGPQARPGALRYQQMTPTEIPQTGETSQTVGAVVMASFLGLILGLTSTPKMAMAEEAAPAPVFVDKKAKLKAEIEKAQASIKKTAETKEERLKRQIQQLKDVAKTADTTFATK
eukprot:Skav201876  [mRNA]  locus=scaffold550:110817:111230:- [translate_table: standard]